MWSWIEYEAPEYTAGEAKAERGDEVFTRPHQDPKHPSIGSSKGG